MADDSKRLHLDDREQCVVSAMLETHPDTAFANFRMLTARTGMDRPEVRRIVRGLARKGLTVYGRGLWTEDNLPGGAGYALTDAGHDWWERECERLRRAMSKGA